MTVRRLGFPALVVLAGPAAYWISTAIDIPQALTEVTLVALGGGVLTASFVGRLTPQIARSWRPELGILLLMGAVAGAVGLGSHGMPVGAAGMLMSGTGPVILTLRAGRLLGGMAKAVSEQHGRG